MSRIEKPAVTAAIALRDFDRGLGTLRASDKQVDVRSRPASRCHRHFRSMECGPAPDPVLLDSLRQSPPEGCFTPKIVPPSQLTMDFRA
jgi:hypothetical protein